MEKNAAIAVASIFNEVSAQKNKLKYVGHFWTDSKLQFL